MRGQYKRLLRLTKQSLYKSIGKSLLTWSDLEEVLLYVEVNLNNQPLTYIEEDLEYSVMTLNSMILGRDIKFPDDSPEEEEVSDNLKKRQRYVDKYKEATWKRWVHEYLAALRERNNLSHKEKPLKININNVVKLKGDEKNGGKCKTGIIENIFMGKDNTIRSIRVHTGKCVIERPIQLLYTMELHSDSKTTTSTLKMTKHLTLILKNSDQKDQQLQ